jgi:hypothetical protein
LAQNSFYVSPSGKDNDPGSAAKPFVCRNSSFTTEGTLDVATVKTKAGLERSYVDIKDIVDGDPSLDNRSK